MTEGVQEITNHRADWIRTESKRVNVNQPTFPSKFSLLYKGFVDGLTDKGMKGNNSRNLLDLERRGFEHDSVVGDGRSPRPDGELAFVAFDVLRDPDLRSRQLALEGVFRLTIGVLQSKQKQFRQY